MHFILSAKNLMRIVYKSLEISCVTFVGNEVNEVAFLGNEVTSDEIKVSFEEIVVSVSLKTGRSIEMSDQSSVVVLVDFVPDDLPSGVT